MAGYRILFRPSVEKDLRALPREMASRVWEKIEALAEEPLPRSALKLSGAQRLYRIRVGDYRVIYEVEISNQTITIQYVRHRRDAYRGKP